MRAKSSLQKGAQSKLPPIASADHELKPIGESVFYSLEDELAVFFLLPGLLVVGIGCGDGVEHRGSVPFLLHENIANVGGDQHRSQFEFSASPCVTPWLKEGLI